MTTREIPVESRKERVNDDAKLSPLANQFVASFILTPFKGGVMIVGKNTPLVPSEG